MTPALREQPGVCPPRLERGEMAKPTDDERFWSKINRSGPVPQCAPHLGPCWLWLGSTVPWGYGRFFVGSSAYRAHRYSYEKLRGPIPPGLVLDHLCRVKHCVNPDHLEPVTDRVNVLRGVGLTARQAKQTHCIHGHEFTPENTYRAAGSPRERRCKECGLLRSVAKRSRKAAEAQARAAGCGAPRTLNAAVLCELAPGHAGDHRGSGSDGRVFVWTNLARLSPEVPHR